MKKSLAIVVLTWNDFKNTKNCIRSIYPQLNKKTKLILVDNDSDKKIYTKTIDWLKKNYKNDYINLRYDKKFNFRKNIIILKNNKNLGCGYGHNTGYKFSIKNNFEFIARIDNDMVVRKNFFSSLLNHFNKTDVLGVSPKIMYKFSPKKIWWMGTTIGNSLKFQRHMRNYSYGLLDSKKINGIVETDAIAGCASIMRASRLKKIGLSDKDFFYGPEDVEFSRRIYNKPGSLIVDRNVKIYHAVTQSFVNLSRRRIYFEYKYRLVLIKKIGTIGDKFFGYSTSLIKFILYCCLFMKKKHNVKIIPVFFAIKHFIEGKLGDYDRKIGCKF